MADAASKAGKLARIHRVREVQAQLAQAEEARARDKAAAEAALHGRIAGLVDAVSPRPVATNATSLAAAAHYRERLHTSAAGADARMRTAQAQLDRSRIATRDALRDRTAMSKLLDRARADEAQADARREAEAGGVPQRSRRNRHDPC